MCSCAEIGFPIDLRRVSQGISGVAQRKSSHLPFMVGNGVLLWSQCRGIGHHLELIWATPNYFIFLCRHQCPSRLMRVLLGTLWNSVKQIKAPYFVDWEHAISLHAMQGNQASSLGEGEDSWFFSSCGRNLGYILELRQGWPFKLVFVQRHQDSCLIMMHTSGI